MLGSTAPIGNFWFKTELSTYPVISTLICRSAGPAATSKMGQITLVKRQFWIFVGPFSNRPKGLCDRGRDQGRDQGVSLGILTKLSFVTRVVTMVVTRVFP